MTKIFINIALNSTNNVNIGRRYICLFIFLQKSSLNVELNTTCPFKYIDTASSSFLASMAIKTGVLPLLEILSCNKFYNILRILMFYKIFLSSQVKQIAIRSNKRAYTSCLTSF